MIYVIRAASFACLAAALAGLGARLDPRADLVNIFIPVIVSVCLIVIFTAWRWRSRLAGGIALIALVVLGWNFTANSSAKGRIAPPAATAPERPLRVVAFNAFHANHDADVSVRALIALRPDVLILQETRGLQGRPLDRLRRAYPHASACRQACDMMILSRYPADGFKYHFRDARNRPVGAPLVQGTIRPPGQPPFTVVSLHLARPYKEPLVYRAGIDRLAETLAERRDPSLIAAGDFNQVPWTVGLSHFSAVVFPLRRLNGLAPTYPADATFLGIPVPALLPIDHLFAGPQWRADSITTLQIPGSDHKARVYELLRSTGSGTYAKVP